LVDLPVLHVFSFTLVVLWVEGLIISPYSILAHC